MSVSVENKFDALQASPSEEGKSWEGSRGSMKDDMKQQAYEAREGLKAKATTLKEQVAGSSLLESVSSSLQSGLETAKSKMANLAGDPSLKDASKEELAERAEEGWQTVKREARHRGQKAADEHLTSKQKAQLAKAAKSAKQTSARAQRSAQGIFARLTSSPRMRGFRGFIERNNLQLPVMIFGSVLALYLCLSMIRLVTMVTTPKVPEFDIHSKENTINWLKWHAGDYRDRAIDAKDTLAERAATFLASHELDKLQSKAVDWKEIGMKRLGLKEPSWSESAYAWLTGQPVTWQERVESVLDLASHGIKLTALKEGIHSMGENMKDAVGIHQPTYWERIKAYAMGRDLSLKGRMQDQASDVGERVGSSIGGVMDSIRSRIPGLRPAPVLEPEGLVDSVKQKLEDGVAEIRSHLPGSADAKAQLEAARARAYAAAHPSTLDNIKSGAEYIKNRVVHGSQEAAHIAQDRANEVIDKAKYKTGL